MSRAFDADARERELRAQAESWDTSAPKPAEPGDIPVAGDWNGDGKDAVGVYRPSTGQFVLETSLGGTTTTTTERRKREREAS